MTTSSALESWSAPRDLFTEPVAQLAQASQQQPFDAVVIGGGTAGVVAGLTLAGRGQRVALLEAGPLALLTHVQSTDIRFQRGAPALLRGTLEYAPQHASSGESFGVLIGCLGGRGLFWSGACPRMQPHEIIDWPLDFEELLPHYAWVEEQFRVSTSYGDSALLQVMTRQLRQAGWPFLPCPFAVDTHPTADGWLGGTIGNAMSLLLRGGALTGEQRNPRIAVRAFAARILLAAGGEARGVLALDRDSATEPAEQAGHEIYGHRVLLAAGALESVRLAQVSEVPDPSGRLGTGVVDHLYARSYITIPLEWYDPHRREVALGYLPSTADRAYQVEIHAPSALLFAAREGVNWQPGPTEDYRVLVRAFAPVRPNPANLVEPLEGDRPGSYRVHLDYADQDRAVLDALVAGMRKVQSVLGDQGTEPQVRPPGHSYHEAGGLGMGTNANASVTDAAGRFWGCPNLVACDASAWPSIGAANVHLSIAAVARRNALLAMTT